MVDFRTKKTNWILETIKDNQSGQINDEWFNKKTLTTIRVGKLEDNIDFEYGLEIIYENETVQNKIFETKKEVYNYVENLIKEDF